MIFLRSLAEVRRAVELRRVGPEDVAYVPAELLARLSEPERAEFLALLRGTGASVRAGMEYARAVVIERAWPAPSDAHDEPGPDRSGA